MARAPKTTGQPETVRGEYTSGTGFEAGQIAPSTKYVDENGKVVDDEPKGIGRVLVAAGDVVRPYMVDVMNGGDYPGRGSVANEGSPGDSSHREPLSDDDES